MNKINQAISAELRIPLERVEKTVNLIEEGNTIPFIARYRKEVTGNLSDEILRKLEDLLKSLKNLEARREEIINILEKREVLTPELRQAVEEAKTLQEMEDIYLPYKQRRKTKASKAIERGLTPLAELIKVTSDATILQEAAKEYLEEGETVEEILEQAGFIIAEEISVDPSIRNMVRKDAMVRGLLETKVKEDPQGTYQVYHEFSTRIKDLKPHQTLAIFRGEKEEALTLTFVFTDNYIHMKILQSFPVENTYLPGIVEDSYKRLLKPSIETEVRGQLKEYADARSIDVFSKNLQPYLMQPPIKGKVVLGLDPGYRTGCKFALVNAFGDYQEGGVIYLTHSEQQKLKAKDIVTILIEKYKVDIIAIGNGTASRETQEFIADLLEEKKLKVLYAVVNESGASIYSASELANEEFKDLDVTIRGAVSIARRLQDPLAELVKISPEHIGVGQYQHDVNQKQLVETLEKVVEDCVNKVGVDVNSASYRLLSYVSGISESVAKNIVEFRKENQGITDRNQLKKVKGLGPKTFEQAAGFIRIPESKNPLDNTGVHPESYSVAKLLLDRDLSKISVKELSKEMDIGEYTLRDIITELQKPGRDPRDEMPQPVLRKDVLSIEDLQIDMVLEGTVRNVVDFGAFVDIGIKNDGLIHISELSHDYIRHPSQVVEVGDIVKVRVIRIDTQREKVSLSMKGKKS